jgi:hypothetical protein
LRQLWFLALNRRDLHPIHAASVSVDGRAVVVLGPSGAGKSTFAHHLASQGAGFLSDDVTLVSGDRMVVGIHDWSRMAPGGVLRASGVELSNGKVATLPGTSAAPAPPGLVVILGDVHERVRTAPADVMGALVWSALLTVDPEADRKLLRALSTLAATPAVLVPKRAPLPPIDEVRRWMQVAP